MDEFTGGVPGKPGRTRRQKTRVVILVVCAALALTYFVGCCAIVVAVAGVFHGLALGLGSAFDGLLNGLFKGIFAALGPLLIEVLYLLLLAISWIMELLTLLSTGQVLPFFMRLARLVLVSS
jgi:hypothetical protein